MYPLFFFGKDYIMKSLSISQTAKYLKRTPVRPMIEARDIIDPIIALVLVSKIRKLINF